MNPMEIEKSTESETAKKPRKRWLWRGLVLIALLVVSAELFARFYLGFGDPPLLRPDPEIEYLYQPSQTCRRFGKRIHYNQWSMRSPDFPKDRPADELRVLLVGDSIVNAGVLTDDSETATALLQQDLSKRFSRKVVVGNIGAGSWGPENQLAYLRRYGTFGAQLVVFIWSEHDVYDYPKFDVFETNPQDHPTRKPLLALSEIVMRYIIPRYLPALLSDVVIPEPAKFGDPMPRCVNAMKEQIHMVRNAGAEVLIVRHYSVPDFQVSETPGHFAIRRLAEAEGVPMISMDAAILKTNRERGGYYRGNDPNHPSVLGQRVLAEQMLQPVSELLEKAVKSGS